MERTPQIEFLDPLSESGAEVFDPLASMEAITARYLDNEVEHDYTADKFVSDTQSLMLDAQFVGKFEEAQAIAMRMHQMCGEDHGLQMSLNANESFSSALEGMLGSNEHDGHDHGPTHDYDEDGTKKSKKKKRQPRRGWLSRSR
jgi:hypothetical protein